MLNFIASCQAIATSANWLTDVRIWPAQPLYPLTAQYDFMAQSPLSTVVTVTGLRLFSNFRGNCSYSAIDGFKASSLKNAVFILNVNLSVPAQCSSVEVSFINSAAGILDNITVTGWVNMSSVNSISIKASQFIGHVFNTSSVGSFFTNLSFLLNNASISNATANVVISPSNLDGTSIGTTQSMNNAVLSTNVITTCTGTYKYYSQATENAHPNLIKEWYPARLELFEWKMMRSETYYFIDFDSTGAITTDFTLSVQRAYYYPGTANIAVFFQDGSQLECLQLYNPVAKICVSSCPSKVFELFCQAACPANYFSSTNASCYVTCPAKLGLYPSSSTCVKCANLVTFSLTNAQCVATCPATSPVALGSGCFPKTMLSNTFTSSTCPLICTTGQLMDSSCISTCPEGKYNQSALRICESCLTSYNGGSFWKRDGAVCATSCDYLNGTYCEDLASTYCEYYYLDGSQKKCVHTCPVGYPYLQETEKRCYTTCPNTYLVDTPNMKCVTSCPSNYYYYSSSTRFCLATCGGTNYTAIESVKHISNLRCESSCSLFDSKPFSNAHTCVPDCKSTSNKFIAVNGLDCVNTCSFYHYETGTGVFTCLADCNSKFNGFDNTYSTTVKRCENSCSMFSTTKFTKDNLCQDQCDGAKPYFVTGNICVAQCYDQASLKFLNEGSNACVSTCASGSYYRNNADQFLFCTPAACAASNFTGVESYHATYTRCESSCALFQTLNFIDGQSCLLACPTERKYFDDVKNCSASCPSAIPYAEADNHCVSLCASQNYSVRADIQPKICTGVCPVFFVVNASNSNSKQCVSECFSQTTHKFIDTITSECVAVCPAPFYNRDSSTQFLTCLPDCSSNQHGLDVTYDATMERCEAACSDFSTPKFTKDNLCQDQCDGAKPYFITGNICVAQCYDQASLKFLNEGSNACVSTCASGSYYRVNANQFLFCTPAACAASNFTGVESYHATYSRCESSCALFQTLNFIDGQSCLLVCPTERKYFDDVKNCSASCPSAIPYAEADNHCVSLCASQNYSVRADVQPKICTGVCPIFFVVNASNSNSKQCVSECFSQTTHKFIDTITSECVAVCPAPFYNRDSSTQFLTCLPDCSSNQHGLDVTYDATMERCEAACSMFSTTKFTKDDLCQDQCDGAKPYFITGNICVAQCYDQASLKFLNEGSNACVSTCASGSYYRVNANQFMFCTPAACAASNFTGVESYHATYTRCESSCALFQTLNFIDGQSCLLVCPTERKYFDDVKNCSASCPSAIPYAEADNHCVSLCASQNYSVRADVQPKICTGVCPIFFVVNASNSNSKQCVSECFSQTTHKFIDTITSECVAVCPAPFYNRDSSTQFLTCLPDCSSNQHGLDVTYDATMERCEAACSMFSTTKFTKDDLCQDQCDGAKPYFITGNICVAQCYDQASLKFLNEGSNACVSTCAFGSYYRVNANQFLFCTPAACAASNFTGVESYHATYSRCENSCALFQTLNFIDGHSCLLVCPAERKYFDDVKNCSASCPSAIPYAEADNHCVSLCASQNYSVRADVQPKICTGVCPVFFVVNASNSNSKQCVSECFSQTTHKFINTITSECVAVCPAPFYNRDSSTQFLTCLPDCSSNQHGLDVTYDATMERCEAACSDFSTTKFTKDNLCQDQCDGAKPYFITGNICVAQCYDQASLKFLNEGSNACVSTCASGSYYRVNANQFLFCTPAACAASNFTGVESYHATYTRCESSCALFQTLNFIDGQSCLLACPTERKYFDDVKNCSASCPSAIPYAEADNHCVSLCASQNYSVRADIQPKICTGVCPVFFVVNASNSDSKQCVSECFSQTTHKFIDTITSECVAVCPAPFYNRDSSTQFLTCLPDCSSNQHGLDVTYDATMERCEVKCSMFSTLKFNIQEEQKCVDDCPNNLYWQDLTLEKFCLISCGSGNYSANDGLSATRCEPTCQNFEVLKIRYQDTCILKCNYFLKEDECLHSCTLPLLQQVNLCVDSCTEGFKQYWNICSDCVLDQEGLCVEDVTADIIKSVKSGMNTGTWVSVAVLALALVAVCVYLLKYLQKAKQFKITASEVDQTNGFDSLFDQTLNRTTDQVNDNCDDCEDIFTKHRRERVVVKI
ncbi:Conserved_hypothetical protein [Hexamita inflata]|uniref:Uncharacterized protein n=1 Tax=Hexamita inflata TaxID=28002 RepID=A0AA86PSG7_9EUKA|nr:Conserved hypothetical protein [Hexamita inflata]